MAKDTMARIHWVKITAPRPWKPQKEGDELVGSYGGKTVKNGVHGEYAVVLVRTEKGGFMVSGIQAVQSLDGAGVKEGTPVKIVFRGWATTTDDRKMKKFDVFMGELKLEEG
jgi:hypothetical protein